jgi:hypothetical protein
MGPDRRSVCALEPPGEVLGGGGLALHGGPVRLVLALLAQVERRHLDLHGARLGAIGRPQQPRIREEALERVRPRPRRRRLRPRGPEPEP